MYSLNIFTLMLPPSVLMDGVKLIVTNASASWKTKVLTKKMECMIRAIGLELIDNFNLFNC